LGKGRGLGAIAQGTVGVRLCTLAPGLHSPTRSPAPAARGPAAIYALCRLGVPDALNDEPAGAATAAALAARLGCDAACLLRLLRLCAAYGLLVEVAAEAEADTACNDAKAQAAVPPPPPPQQQQQTADFEEGVDAPGGSGDGGGGSAVAASTAAEGGGEGDGERREGGGRDDGPPLRPGLEELLTRSTAFHLTESGVMLQVRHCTIRHGTTMYD
jgi:hypothetical protein